MNITTPSSDGWKLVQSSLGMPYDGMSFGKVGRVVLSFISMYVLMYAMVDSFANVYPNFNQSYMAGLMTG